jgi:LmbE family N-acetylglucosaminyl deacetylase
MTPVNLGSILGVWAHPDDEVYLSGGLMAAAVRAGRHVTVVTATSGQSGTSDPATWPPEKLGPFRQQEMAEAMTALGVTDIRWLDYDDGRCSTVPDQEAVAKLEAIITEINPDSVLTFGPDGITGHEDHLAVCRWTTTAFAGAARPGARLYYACVPEDWYEQWGELLGGYGVYYPGFPIVYRLDDVAVRYRPSDELMTLKSTAIRAHASQVEGFIESVGDDLFMTVIRDEVFRLGAEKT